MDGRKEIFGIWISENESAGFWLNVCNDLKTEVSRIYSIYTVYETLPCFPDGNSALMLVCARLRHIATSTWGSKRYMNMNLLISGQEVSRIG